MIDPKLTPGKTDDVLVSAACFFTKLSGVCTYASENYIDPDGTFQDLKLVEFSKWLPVVQYLVQQSQIIAEECFGKDATPEIKNDILRIILTTLGVKIDNPLTLNFLSKL